MVTVTKDFDRGSVELIQNMVDAVVIPEVQLLFYQTSNPAGPVYYSIVLEAVRILAIDQVVEHQEGTSPYYAHMEKISFAFETIEWIWEDGGISFQDHLDPGPPADGTTK
jgi:type VI secretion system Hcp family effector